MFKSSSQLMTTVCGCRASLSTAVHRRQRLTRTEGLQLTLERYRVDLCQHSASLRVKDVLQAHLVEDANARYVFPVAEQDVYELQGVRLPPQEKA